MFFPIFILFNFFIFSNFSISHSPFPIPHSPIPHSPFPIPHSPFPIPHFPIPHSPFPISPFPIPHSPFPIPRFSTSTWQTSPFKKILLSLSLLRNNGCDFQHSNSNHLAWFPEETSQTVLLISVSSKLKLPSRNYFKVLITLTIILAGQL